MPVIAVTRILQAISRKGSLLGGAFFPCRLMSSEYPLREYALGTNPSSQPSIEHEVKSGPLKKAAIYTRTGDRGTTSLFSGGRVKKTHAIIQSLGDNDELTSALGVALEHIRRSTHQLAPLPEHLLSIQCAIQELNTHIATLPDSKRASSTIFDPEGKWVSRLEDWIDSMDAKLDPLRNFILPSGGVESAQLHLTRAICRRAERSLHGLIEEGGVNEASGKFLNRLSDYLFTAARYACQATGNKEEIYQKTINK